jgi:leader peptidase (prepilin peptidase)/N-methyltransferase
VGLAAGFGALWVVGKAGTWAFKKDAMGFGDVKLLGAIGAFIGWQGVLFTLMLSSLLGSVVGLALIASRRKQWQSRIPYGPYLALAAWIWILWGYAWWERYADYLAAAG